METEFMRQLNIIFYRYKYLFIRLRYGLAEFEADQSQQSDCLGTETVLILLSVWEYIVLAYNFFC